jgi:putative inorganic carbon (hco3(-)) transporter
MGIRDFIVFAVVFGGLPFMLRMPSIGVIYWAWLGLMNPHRQAWGLAFSFPFAMVIALATLLGLMFSKEPRRFKGGAAAWVLFAFMVWTWVTTAFALAPDDAMTMLNRVFKIQLFTFISLLALYKREHVLWLAAALVVSIGYYAVKGGAFTLATAGANRVWGPSGTYIFDNNALAVATIMSIPLGVYFYILAQRRWMKYAIVLCLGLSAASAIGSHSRGALLAITAMSLFLWWGSRRKVVFGAFLICAGAALVWFMPSQWEDRMSTIATYEKDTSAQGRLDAWLMLFRLAVDRPLIGGGFEPYTKEVYERYNPEFVMTQGAHSIYFQVLGEQGFVGFFLFLLFWALTWRMSMQIIAKTRTRADSTWAYWLAKMVQVSIIGYLVGGAFLNLAYWDMPYYLMVLLAVTRHVVVESGPGEASVGEPHTSPQVAQVEASERGRAAGA